MTPETKIKKDNRTNETTKRQGENVYCYHTLRDAVDRVLPVNKQAMLARHGE